MEQRLQQCYCYSCLDVETNCRDGGCRGVRTVSGCTLRTLYFVNSGEVASGEMLLITLLLMTLLLMTCLQELFLQTRFFRRISSRRSKLQIKFLCSLTCSIRIFMNKTLILDHVHLNKFLAIQLIIFNTLLSSKLKR